MANVKLEIVSALPGTLAAHTLYMVGAGNNSKFVMTNAQGAPTVQSLSHNQVQQMILESSTGGSGSDIIGSLKMMARGLPESFDNNKWQKLPTSATKRLLRTAYPDLGNYLGYGGIWQAYNSPDFISYATSALNTFDYFYGSTNNQGSFQNATVTGTGIMSGLVITFQFRRGRNAPWEEVSFNNTVHGFTSNTGRCFFVSEDGTTLGVSNGSVLKIFQINSDNSVTLTNTSPTLVNTNGSINCAAFSNDKTKVVIRTYSAAVGNTSTNDSILLYDIATSTFTRINATNTNWNGTSPVVCTLRKVPGKDIFVTTETSQITASYMIEGGTLVRKDQITVSTTRLITLITPEGCFFHHGGVSANFATNFYPTRVKDDGMFESLNSLFKDFNANPLRTGNLDTSITILPNFNNQGWALNSLELNPYTGELLMILTQSTTLYAIQCHTPLRTNYMDSDLRVRPVFMTLFPASNTNASETNYVLKLLKETGGVSQFSINFPGSTFTFGKFISNEDFYQNYVYLPRIAERYESFSAINNNTPPTTVAARSLYREQLPGEYFIRALP